MTTSESTKIGKTRKDILGEKDQNKTADKKESRTGRDKSKDIVERRETQKIMRQHQVIKRKQDFPK